MMPTFLLPAQICHLTIINVVIARSVPNAFILTLISITIVFLALICLTYTYSLIEKIANINLRRPKKQKESDRPGEKEAAAIGIALNMYMNEDMHDEESYVITIKRKP